MMAQPAMKIPERKPVNDRRVERKDKECRFGERLRGLSIGEEA